MRAICLRCGSEKDMPWRACDVCAFAPEEGSEAMVQSVYLSVLRYTHQAQRTEYVGLLSAFAAQIRQGQPIDFDAEELARLERQQRAVVTVSSKAIWGAVGRLFLPAILVLLALAALLVVLKRA